MRASEKHNTNPVKNTILPTQELMIDKEVFDALNGLNRYFITRGGIWDFLPGTTSGSRLFGILLYLEL